MAQKSVEVTATNGSATVTLSDTSGIIAGKSYFKRSNEGVPGAYTDVYQVSSIVADTSVTLTASYTGTTGTFTGLFVNDFTSNQDLPLIYTGDLDIPDFLNRAWNILDSMVLNGGSVSFSDIETTTSTATGNSVQAITVNYPNAGSGDNSNIGYYFDTSSGSDRKKGAIIFEETASNARGSLHFCVNDVADSSDVTYADAAITISSDKSVTITSAATLSSTVAISDTITQLDATTATGNSVQNLVLGYSNASDGDNSNLGIYFAPATNAAQSKGAIIFERTASYGRGTMHFCCDNTGDSSDATYSDAALSLDRTKNATFGNKVTVSSNATGAIVTGGEASPDAHVTLNQGANNVLLISGKSSDVAHPFSADVDDDTFLGLGKASSTAGGALFQGFSEGGNAAIRLEGRRETVSTSDTGGGVIVFDAYKSNGTTGSTTLADNENLFSARNGTSAKEVTKGNGDKILQGTMIQLGGIKWVVGSGSPESAVTAPVGSFYSRTDGGAGTSWYVKESGTGNTGWVAK